MRIITLEEHFADEQLMRASQAFQPPPTQAQIELQEAFKLATTKLDVTIEELFDVEKYRLPFMDKNRITMQVLSYTAQMGDFVPAEESVKLCRQSNDILAEVVAKHPKRFAAFAILPMADPEAAAAELERTVKEYNFCGPLLAGQFKGRFYNEAEFFPIFAKAAELDVPVHFHPANVKWDIQSYYYQSDNYSKAIGAVFGGYGFGWHVDVGIHVLRMIFSGIFDKLPTLKIISGHWGETVPAFLDRFDMAFRREVTGLKKNISDYYRANVYLTPSGILSVDQLEYLVKVMGADHILHAVDYPYIKPKGIYEFIADSRLTDEQKELIAHGNAERILHLPTD